MTCSRRGFFSRVHRPISFQQRGVGLVELMIGLVLGLFLIAGIIQIYLGSKSSYRVTEGMSRLQENARYAMTVIGRELSAGGHMGCLDTTPSPPPEPAKIVNTLTNKTTEYDFETQVTGSDGPDTLTIRRAVARGSIPVIERMASQASSIKLDSSDPDYAALEQYQVLTLSNCTLAAVFMITNDPSSSSGVIQHQTGVTAPSGGINPGQSNATTDLEGRFGNDGGSVATVFQTQSSTFDISNGRLRLNNQELIEGVSDMQVVYGLPAAGGTIKYVDAGSVGADWALVEAVRIRLTFNTVEQVSTSGTVIDKIYETTFRLRNRDPDKS